MTRLVADRSMPHPAADTYLITLRCAHTLEFTTTRISCGRSFDEALDRSLEAEPEDGFTIAAAARWDKDQKSWFRFEVPQYEYSD